MRRRTVLATVPALLAGCSGRSTHPDGTPIDSPTDSPGGSTPETPTDAPPETPTDAPSETPTETPTESPPPWAEFDLLELERPTLRESDVRARLDDRDCGELNDGAVCPGDDARVTVSLSRSIASLPEAEVELSIRNDADEQFRWNPYDWKFWTFDGRSWRRLAPLGWPMPESWIDPGSTFTYTLQLNHGPFEDIDVAARSPPGSISFHGLGPGVYGFVNDSGYFGDPRDDPVPVGATFGLAGQAPPLQPTDDVARIERDGSELIVETGTDDEKWELLVTFVDRADADLLPTHVRTAEGLRNTVSFAPVDGIDAVRYVTSPKIVNTVENYLSAWTPDGTTSYGIADVAFEIA